MLAEGTSRRMISVVRELPLTYAVLSAGRWCGSALAVREMPPTGSSYRASSTAPGGPSARVVPPRRSLNASTGRAICVRYRYDAERKKRFKTVELLVEERDWEPPWTPFADDQIVGLRVAFTDVAVRDRVKQAGGKWHPERRVWQLRYDRAVELGLTRRIVDAPASNSRCRGSSGEHLHADA